MIFRAKTQNKLLTFTKKGASHNFNSYFVNIASYFVRENYETYISDFENFKKYLPIKIEYVFEHCSFQPEDVRWIIAHLNSNISH